MDHAVISQWANILVYVCLGLAAIFGLYKFILLEYRTARIRNAPEVTVRATVYYKDPDCFPVPAGRTTNYVYHITFHTESGEAVKLYMDRDAYFSIPEGASGELLYQAERLWRFTLDDGTVIVQ